MNKSTDVDAILASIRIGEFERNLPVYLLDAVLTKGAIHQLLDLIRGSRRKEVRWAIEGIRLLRCMDSEVLPVIAGRLMEEVNLPSGMLFLRTSVATQLRPEDSSSEVRKGLCRVIGKYEFVTTEVKAAVEAMCKIVFVREEVEVFRAAGACKLRSRILESRCEESLAGRGLIGKARWLSNARDLRLLWRELARATVECEFRGAVSAMLYRAKCENDFTLKQRAAFALGRLGLWDERASIKFLDRCEADVTGLLALSVRMVRAANGGGRRVSVNEISEALRPYFEPGSELEEFERESLLGSKELFSNLDMLDDKAWVLQFAEDVAGRGLQDLRMRLALELIYKMEGSLARLAESIPMHLTPPILEMLCDLKRGTYDSYIDIWRKKSEADSGCNGTLK